MSLQRSVVIYLEKLKKMSEDKLIISSAVCELAEAENYIELTNRLCYYDEPNLNGVLLPSEGAQERAETLVGQPVVAKWIKNPRTGKDDLGGHEVTVDENGDVVFGTESIGVHEAVWIAEDDVVVGGMTERLPCLFAKSRIWKRKPNLVNAVKRLYNEGRLHSSWEIMVKSYTFENGIKTCNDYIFDSNCLLGEDHAPAYGSTATAISMSAQDVPSLLIAEALALDINESVEKEDEILDMQYITTNSTSGEYNASQPEIQSSTETAELTIWDLQEQLTYACREKLGKYCYAAYVFPETHQCWCVYDGASTALDYMLFNYSVNGDNVSVDEGTPVRLTVSIAQINDTLAEKDAALVAANETVATLSDELANLKWYKEQYEAAEAERKAVQKAERVAQLRELLIKSRYFSESDLESEPISSLLESADEAGVKALIADRFMETLNEPVVVSETTPRTNLEVPTESFSIKKLFELRNN